MTLEFSALGLLLAFGGGLVSFLSPCVLPLVPGWVAYACGTGVRDAPPRARAMLLGASFVLGFSLVFVLLGLGASALSQWLRRWSLEFQIAGGALVLAFGLVQIGALRPSWLLRDVRLPAFAAGGTPGGAVLLGVSFGFAWTPCIGPILGAVLAVAAIQGDGAGGPLLLAYSLGLGVPFLLVAFYLPAAAATLRRWRGFGRGAQVASGLVMAAMGVLMMLGEMTRIAGWFVQTFPFLLRLG
ncbi:cytochrome C biogenesis protein [Roseomonas frigidaquae]|uniref:Cytochrome C biogenesis protein n=1 Tax=Falsiroseomonas frigidaquae TaxID=487318 RepID=A0ABX1F7X8_9PROT|nr:cytochrome c biogenesis protein CcdA [Falsiroseomonas frigidaquae]NKE48482.1 cytochrome C biogenesis protein [Falsiroseomonas frigidaquae]